MFESEELSDSPGCPPQESTQPPTTSFLIEPHIRIQQESKISCSSPFNGSLQPPEISMNDISVIGDELQVNSPNNRESFKSADSDGDSSLYRTAYDQTCFTNDVSTNEGEMILPHGSNLLTSKAEIHEFLESPSPTSEKNDSTLMEDTEKSAGEMGKMPDVYDEQVSTSPILSPSPQGFDLKNENSAEGKKLEAEVVPNGLRQQQQLEYEFKSESDSSSPSCEARADSFEFNTCSPFIQHFDSDQHQRTEIVTEELKQEETQLVAAEVVAAQYEQSDFLQEKIHEDQEQLQNMFPPLESTTSYKTEGFEMEEEVIEEPKVISECNIEAVISSEVDPVKSESDEIPSNPFVDFNPSTIEVDGLTKDSMETKTTTDTQQPIDILETSNINFNQVIMESMAISSPVSSESGLSEDNPGSSREANVPSGYSSSFNEDTVIEHISLKNNDGDCNNESSNHLSSKFHGESEDSDSSQDSVKENTFSTSEKTLSLPVAEPVSVDVKLIDSFAHGPSNECAIRSTEEFSSPFGEQSMFGGENAEKLLDDVNQQQPEESGLIMDRNEEEDNQNGIFTNHNSRGTESENEVKNCDEGGNNGSPLLVEDNHDLKQTKEGSVMSDETLDQLNLNEGDTTIVRETNNDSQSNKDQENGELTEIANGSKVECSYGNISQVEMPSPMRKGLVDLNEANQSPVDMSQWGAPSLLIGQHQDLLSTSVMSEASPLVVESENSKTSVSVANPHVGDVMKPELMIDIMNEYNNCSLEKTLTSKLDDQSSQKPLSPKNPTQIPDSVPDLIVQSKSVDLKKAVAGRAKVSRGESQAPDVQKNTSKAAQSKPAPKLTKAIPASAPKVASSSRTIASRPAVATSSIRPTAPAKKVVSVPPKPSVSRTTAPTKTLVVARTQIATTTAPKVSSAPRLMSNGFKTTTRPVSTATKPLTRQPLSTSSLSKALVAPKPASSATTKSTLSASSLKPVAPKSSAPTTSGITARNVRTTGVRVGTTAATRTTLNKTSTETRKTETSKPTSVSVAPRAVKKPVKPEVAAPTNGKPSNGTSTNGNH